MNEIKGYDKLTEAQRKLLWYIHKKHLSFIGSKELEIGDWQHSAGVLNGST
jgi:hypothetical protein